MLTLVLLGGVEVFPTVYRPKPGVMGGLCESYSLRYVMMIAGYLPRNQVNIVDAVTLEVYEWLGQYS